MLSSLFLAQWLGLFLLLVGFLMVVRRKFFIHAVHDYIQTRSLRFLFPMLELMAGLALILKHSVWNFTPAVLVTLTGWLLAIEGVAYFLIPEKTLVKWLNSMNIQTVYIIGGCTSMALGVVLILYGFQLPS